MAFIVLVRPSTYHYRGYRFEKGVPYDVDNATRNHLVKTGFFRDYREEEELGDGFVPLPENDGPVAASVDDQIPVDDDSPLPSPTPTRVRRVKKGAAKRPVADDEEVEEVSKNVTIRRKRAPGDNEAEAARKEALLKAGKKAVEREGGVEV